MRPDMKPAAAAGRSNKLPGLELLRFLTALAILLFHYRQFAFVGDREVGLVQDQLPLYWLFGPLYHSGPYAVRAFWWHQRLHLLLEISRCGRRSPARRMEILRPAFLAGSIRCTSRRFCS